MTADTTEDEVREMDLLETAWNLIANAGWDGDAKSPGWQEAAVKWRDQYHAALSALTAATAITEPEPEPSLPDGEFARVEIMGHDQVTGWVTDGTRAGVPVMVVRDWDGRVLREVPGHALYQFWPLATPLKRPAPPAAITAGAVNEDQACYCAMDGDPNPDPDCPRHGYAD